MSSHSILIANIDAAKKAGIRLDFDYWKKLLDAAIEEALKERDRHWESVMKARPNGIGDMK